MRSSQNCPSFKNKKIVETMILPDCNLASVFLVAAQLTGCLNINTQLLIMAQTGWHMQLFNIKNVCAFTYISDFVTIKTF